jgi:Hemimethylated DNA-binding protein YccV like
MRCSRAARQRSVMRRLAAEVALQQKAALRSGAPVQCSVSPAAAAHTSHVQAANAEDEEAQKAQRTVEPRLRLGQRVRHTGNGMAGVVVGWDRACCEKEGWRERNGVRALAQARAVRLTRSGPAGLVAAMMLCMATTQPKQIWTCRPAL